jgi:hypothetical protein
MIASDGDVFLQVNSTGLAMSDSPRCRSPPSHLDLTLATGNLTVDAPVTLANTDIALRTVGANANIHVNAGGSVFGRNVTLVATGTITGDNPGTTDIVAADAISLTGDLGIGGGSPLVVFHGPTGDVSATTTTGNVYLHSPVDLVLGIVTTAGGSAQTVDVRSNLDLSISGASNTNDNWTLAAPGNILYSGSGQVTAANLTAIAGVRLLSGTAGTDVTVTGTANLTAATGIGTALNRFAVVTGSAGLVNATTTLAAAPILLESTGLLRVGQITTAAGVSGPNHGPELGV